MATVTDRNGNETRYEYDGDGRLVGVVDPAGLRTTFEYTNGKITGIIDPAQRSTTLSYDSSGNLLSVEDPDGSKRAWDYDSHHRLTSEVTARDHLETIHYDFAGRVQSVERADGSRVGIRPANLEGLHHPSLTTDIASPPSADTDFQNEAFFVDGNGNTERYLLDRAGQLVSSSDVFGTRVTINRNANNLVENVVDGRGNLSSFDYDDSGNLQSSVDDVVRGGDVVSGSMLPGEGFFVGRRPFSIITGDFNNDRIADMVTANRDSGDVSLLLGKGDGTFQDERRITVGSVPVSVTSADFNSDGYTDLAVANSQSNNVSVLLGNGDGRF